MTEKFRLIACPTLGHERRTDQYLVPGRTLKDYLREIGWVPERVYARVSINGEIVPDAEWLDAKPLAGQSVVVRSVPTGGDGKQAGQIVGLIVLAVAAAYVGGGNLAIGGWLAQGSTSAAFAGVIVGIGGSLALNGHIPKPLPRRTPVQK